MTGKDKLIRGLNEDLNREPEAVLRYLYHSASATGLLGHELRELLKADVTSELQHARFLADKITALGGQVNLNVSMPRTVRSAKDMLEEDVKAERLVIRLENMLAEETDQAEELERLGR